MLSISNLAEDVRDMTLAMAAVAVQLHPQLAVSWWWPCLRCLCSVCVWRGIVWLRSKAGHGWWGLFQAAFLRLSDGGNATLLSPTSQNGFKRMRIRTRFS